MPCPRRAVAMLAPVALSCALAACSGTGSSAGNCVSSVQSPLGVTVCPDGGVVHGVDVSEYQGNVDWPGARDAGIAFAFARVSDGTGHPDTEFATNWPAMKTAGVVRGAYQFFRPEEDPTTQANLFASMLAAAGGIAPGDLPPVMDLEVTDNTPDATIQSRMQTWFSAMQSATGLTPLLYFSPSFAPHAGTSFGGHALWVAEWGAKCPSVPTPWSTWAFWQTSDMGSIAGIHATVDLDEFNGPLADLPVLGPSSDAGGGTDAGAQTDAGPPYADASAAADGGAGTDGASSSDGGSGGGAPMGSGGGTGACR